MGLKTFGTLFKDIFFVKKKDKTQYGWIRYPIFVKSKYQQSKIIDQLSKDIRSKQIIKK